MDRIDQFLARYRKEYDFYDQSARLVAQLLDRSLQSAGLRAIVTSRAKSLTRLEEKVRQRDKTKSYKNVDEIFADIVDLAGVRVALYFPGEREEVGKIIDQLFAAEVQPKTFPENSRPPTYAKRFSGYWATHYRVRLREASLNDAQKRYAQALIEIQVASVLMHAWAEVEHDLVYKPQQGSLSQDEYAILDEINGMVIAGEIALEQLQRAGKARVAQSGRKFANHYDLADYLLGKAGSNIRASNPDALLGGINILYRLIDELDLATPEALSPYLSDLSTDLERQPLADQVIDRILIDNPERYSIYHNIRKHFGNISSVSKIMIDRKDRKITAQDGAVGRFLLAWIELERQTRRLFGADGNMRVLMPTSKMLRQLNILDERSLAEIDRIRRMRNHLVHGVEPVLKADLEDASSILEEINQRLQNSEPQK